MKTFLVSGPPKPGSFEDGTRITLLANGTKIGDLNQCWDAEFRSEIQFTLSRLVYQGCYRKKAA